MQAETENLLNRTIEYRRQVPQMMKQVYIEESGEAVKEIEKELKEKIELNKEDLELCNLDRSIKPNFYSNKLSSGLSHLTQLESVRSNQKYFYIINFIYLLFIYYISQFRMLWRNWKELRLLLPRKAGNDWTKVPKFFIVIEDFPVNSI